MEFSKLMFQFYSLVFVWAETAFQICSASMTRQKLKVYLSDWPSTCHKRSLVWSTAVRLHSCANTTCYDFAVQEVALPFTRFMKFQALWIFLESSSFVGLFWRSVRRLPQCCAYLRARDEEESLSRSWCNDNNNLATMNQHEATMKRQWNNNTEATVNQEDNSSRSQYHPWSWYIYLHENHNIQPFT